MVMSTEGLSDVFVEVADSLVADFDLVEFLQNLTDRVATVSGAASVGVLLADQHDRLHYMASSNERAKLLELFELQNSEGPCLDCFRTHKPVINTDLADAGERWPLFVPRAIESGFRSVHAVPMRLRAKAIGALSLFGVNDIRFEPADVRIVQALADVATIAILQEQSINRAELLTEQLQSALNTRIVIEQAKGTIAQREGIDVDEAFTLLRSHARHTQQRLVSLAQTVVNNPDAALSTRDAD